MKAVKQTDNSSAASAAASRSRARRRINPASPPTSVELRGVRIHFPFRPYKCQEDYMGKVLDALLRSENALLESPTGTGKTLCLLCATLAWHREQSRLLQQASEFNDASSGLLPTTQDGPNQAARVPTIIYASRTHSQLSQVVRELRNTRYRPTHAVLGSREQMCVNPKVKKAHSCASDINHDCNKLGKERSCRFRNNLEGFTPPSNETGGRADTQPVMDMEDLVSMGKTSKVCPFYYTRSLVEKAELVLVPYNYLFDKDARDTTLADIPWDNAVVIFDEAHNLESFASDSASFDLSNQDVAGCVNEVQRAMNYLQAMPDLNYNLKSENLLKLKSIFLQLEDFILNLSNQGAFSGEFMMEIFQQGASITHANHQIFIEEVRKVNELIMDMRGTGSTRGSPKLEHFIQCLKRVFGYALESRCLAKAAFYRVHVSPKQPGNPNAARTVSYWCFAPALAMEELANLKVRSILVTSGTLSPLPSYAMELGLNFPHSLENPHIISDDQIHVRVIGKGVSGKLLTSSFERRKDGEYYIELGNTLVSLAKVVPAGMLVFFPSYSVMETCLERWGGPSSSRPNDSNARGNFFAARRKQKACSQYSFPFAPSSYYDSNSLKTPWKRLLATKSVVVEPRSTADLADAMTEFQRFLGLPKSTGCILMGVCRGKISEGIDFSNDMSRAVVITGLPFPPSHDPKVKLKREFLDRARTTGSIRASNDGGFGGGPSSTSTSSNKLSGHEWYTQQAHRAVNQAIGRVIRNKSDYGAILLLDSRFGQERNQEGLSRWVRPHIQKDQGFGAAIGSVASFFKAARKNAREMAEAEAKAAANTVVLEYEDDPLDAPDTSKFTKVALIRRPEEAEQNEDNPKAEETEADSTGTAYVAPDQVIARLDVEKSLQSKHSDPVIRKKEPHRPTNSKTGFDAVFDSRQASAAAKRSQVPTAPTNTKEIAAHFMRKVQSGLSATDQSTIRKTIVAMKGYGDKKDIRSYLKSAREIIRLVLRCESFEANDASKESKMLFLFFQLLPRSFRSDVETVAFKLVFESSMLGRMCKENLDTTDYSGVRSSVASLLKLLWCPPDSTDELTPKSYLPKAQEVLGMLQKANKVISTTTFAAYCKLIPLRFANSSRALFEEMRASKSMDMMKQSERNIKGEDSINLARFQPVQSASNKAAPATETTNVSAPKAVMATHASQQTKRKRPDGASHTQQRQFNPYAKKPAPNSVVQMKPKPSPPPPPPQGQTKKPSLSSYLKTVESDTFVKRTAGDIANAIETNAPKNISCPICNEACKQPFLAECGHMACLNCWVVWLERSKSCPTCRVPTTQESLARAVYEKRPATLSDANPSLSQLCSQKQVDNDEETSDEELEIC